MIDEKKAASESREDGEVVYRRIAPSGADEKKSAPVRDGGPARPPDVRVRLAPTLTPLLIGFLILLALTLLLGYLSVRKLDEVSTEILNIQRAHGIKLSYALKLRVAATKLNNEARARARKVGEPSDEVRPFFDLPLNNARNELKKLLPQLDLAPYAESERWRKVRDEMNLFVQATQDLDTYSTEGFNRFKGVDNELDALLADLDQEQKDILQRSEDLQAAAKRRINLLTLFALIVGALVVAATVREVQRRFRQVQRGIEELRRERQFSTQILEGMVSAVAAIDAHDRIRSANAAFFDIFPRASIGASIYDDDFAAPDAMKMLEAATASRVTEATYRGRWVCLSGDANCDDKTFDVYSSPLEIDNEPGQIITLVDATEAARAEAEMRRTESLAAVGQAAAQVAHEIKNPLGSIRLGVAMLRDSARDADSLNTIDLVERGINHLNKLVVDVTQFSRQKPLELAEAELLTLLDESIELIADRIKEKKTPIEKHYSAEPLRGNWDAHQLRQVFVNLLANAVDASAENSPVTITTARVSQSHTASGQGNGNQSKPIATQYARIQIADQGSGMDEQTRARIFEPFFTTKKRGTGLGLAIVKQIIEQHKGTITVESEPGKGTRFTIDLPLKQ